MRRLYEWCVVNNTLLYIRATDENKFQMRSGIIRMLFPIKCKLVMSNIGKCVLTACLYLQIPQLQLLGAFLASNLEARKKATVCSFRIFILVGHRRFQQRSTIFLLTSLILTRVLLLDNFQRYSMGKRLIDLFQFLFVCILTFFSLSHFMIQEDETFDYKTKKKYVSASRTHSVKKIEIERFFFFVFFFFFLFFFLFF